MASCGLFLQCHFVEHVYTPKAYARTLFDLVEPGGTAIVSTPYCGHLKNFALANSGKMDGHFTAPWDYGHIKFWSIPTLTTLLTGAGFLNIRFHGVGRIQALAKSMIAVAENRSHDDQFVYSNASGCTKCPITNSLHPSP
jgi:2-polyprenyl-6-hydroxyphenyl methylase/3-demethylubiquinone-9 3-methyltransferase